MGIPVGRWAEGGRQKAQEAKPGKVLHVEKKTGGSEGFSAFQCWWLGSNQSPI